MFTPKMSLIILKNIYNTKMVKYMNFSFILVHTVLSVLHTVYSYMCFHFFEPIKTWHSVLAFALHSCFLYGVPYRVLYSTVGITFFGHLHVRVRWNMGCLRK